MRASPPAECARTRNELIGEFRMKTSQSAFFVSQRPTHDCFYFAFIKRIQHQNPAARKQSAGYFKGRIFSGSADQGDGAVFDCG